MQKPRSKNTRSPKLHYLTQGLHDLPGNTRWLTREEANVLSGFQFPKRRDDWLLGRWTAKSALIRLTPDPDRAMTHWHIKAERDGAPAVLEDGRKSQAHISLSHSSGRALCLVTRDNMRLGCDLERIEARSSSFEETFFTPGELLLLQGQPARDRARLVTLLWSAKESALKALRIGLKADTRRVVLRSFTECDTGAWSNMEVEDTDDGFEFHGWWRQQAGMVMTTICDQATDPPVDLSLL